MTQIILGDCLEKLKEMKSNSVDSIVTDPPYGLSFLGKHWDHDVPTTEIWSECLRVLKPGGHLLAFFGTRTYHRGVVKIEDAGFEIRDQIQWIYGSGFPKSHNVSKAIDKEAGLKRHRIKTNSQSFSFHKGFRHNEAISDEAISDEAKQWDGWGTALKPSSEPIVVARKPLENGLTVAKNVLKWGCGAINIDDCRIATSDKINSTTNQNIRGHLFGSGDSGKERDTVFNQHPQGRWPANIIFDEQAFVLLDLQSGNLKSGDLSGQPRTENKVYSSAGKTLGMPRYYKGDCGGASRFFYVAKPSPSERGDINTHPTVKPIKLMKYLVRLVTPPNGLVLDPFMGSGSTGIAAKDLGFGFAGIEREPDYFEIAKKRLAGFL